MTRLVTKHFCISPPFDAMLAAYYMEVFGILGKGAKETLPMLNEKPIIPNVDHNCTPNHFGQASPRAAESPLPKKFLPVPVSIHSPYASVASHKCICLLDAPTTLCVPATALLLLLQSSFTLPYFLWCDQGTSLIAHLCCAQCFQFTRTMTKEDITNHCENGDGTPNSGGRNG